MPTIQNLQQQFSNSNHLDIVLLLAHALRKPKEFLSTHPEHRLSPLSCLRFRYYLWQYRRGYSVAAITRHKEFYGLDFYVNKHVLIPRPETELMVNEVLRVLTTDYGLQTTEQTTDYRLQSTDNHAVVRSPSTVVLIDVGTGSGCIPIAIMKTLKHENIKAIAIDVSRKVLPVARKNARTHSVSINFLHGNLLKPLFDHPLPLGEGRGVRALRTPMPSPHPVSLSQRERVASEKGAAVFITANLPYLTPAEFAAEPSIQREPYHTLVAGRTGLELYEQLLRQITLLLKNLQTTDYSLPTTAPIDRAVVCSPLAVVFLEISTTQSSTITALIHRLLPQATVEIKTDLAGRDRIVIIRMD